MTVESGQSHANKSIVGEKSYDFSLRIIKAYTYLIKKGVEKSIARQLLRSGTSIGAQVQEALQAESKPDFIHKFSIANKEANETLYWLRLMKDSDFIETKLADSLINDTREIIKIVITIINTSKRNLKTNS